MSKSSPMPTTYIRTLGALTDDLALVPERYHPAKEQKLKISNSVLLGELVTDVRETVSTTTKSFPRETSFIIYETSDADKGFLQSKTELRNIAEIGSTKKIFRPGDVLISRLRPYLRQVAFVPTNLLRNRPNVILACSTEFYVLRSRGPERSVAFLIPYLLSSDVQEVLSLSQEGGHHPRFSTDTLMKLPVPESVVKQRSWLSYKVEKLSSQYRLTVETLSILAQNCCDGVPIAKQNRKKKLGSR